ncbi:MAG TPA: large conductance mechanosensitive channel protein MscL [Chitinophagaceae bacterium]|nr:large conductance mechanosensitive channel protein MscL [Chitinophagaceae bacterium]
MGLIKEFKEFALKGNVTDLAIGIVIGSAFSAIVGAVVDSILMPVVGIITGGINFDSLLIRVGEAELKYGIAISAAVKFLIIAAFLFLIIKAINKRKKETPQAPPALSSTDKLLTEIRDSLRK